jgi:putative ABC transport system ATP-binding protein
MRVQSDAGSLVARGLFCAVDGRALWRNLELSVRPGERWAITGPSGSGKTVLLRTLAGLTPPQGGEIRFDGEPMNAWWRPAYRARVVYVAQRPALPEGTVQAALAAPFRFRVHHGREYSRDAASRCLAAVGIGAAFLDQDSDRLSGGEAQVVNLLRAILIAPDILLLDEPTASLDPARTTAVEALVRGWMAGDKVRACVWTSHDAAQLARVTDRTLALVSEP